MKRCRTCNRTYTDPNLSYCIDDGTPLTTEFADDSPYRPPPAYVQPGARPPGKQRRAWPWVVGLIGAFVLGAIAISIAAAIFVPRMVRSRQGDLPVVTTNDPDQPDNPDAPIPTDEQQVLAQLTQIENEWTVANINADRKTLDRILADDYVGQAAPAEQQLEGKREYLARIRRDTTIERWELADLKVDLSGDRATLNGKLTLYGRGRSEAYNFTDKFVWRAGRWQATGSEMFRTQ